MLRTLASMVPDTYLLKLLFLTRYINCSLRLSIHSFFCYPSCLPLGEGAERSEAEGGSIGAYIMLAFASDASC